MPQNRLKEDTLNYYKRIKDILSDDTAQDGKYSTKLNLQLLNYQNKLYKLWNVIHDVSH